MSVAKIELLPLEKKLRKKLESAVKAIGVNDSTCRELF